MDITGLGAIAELSTAIINKIWPDADAKARDKLKQALAELAAEMKIRQAQLDINKAEAAHASVWVAGWRPGIGWVAVMSLFLTYVAQPLAVWVIWLMNPTPTPPSIITDQIMFELMFGMLGIGGLRTFEKIKGVAR